MEQITAVNLKTQRSWKCGESRRKFAFSVTAPNADRQYSHHFGLPIGVNARAEVEKCVGLRLDHGGMTEEAGGRHN
ncbi:MAG: hypothetical protein KDB00_27020, partial [Planctomycetales bacterium]|nr:hypothetical protein [Planctomycetales bacterium]